MEQGSARRVLAGVVTALFVAMLAYKVLHAGELEQTALFYVGIPAVIAITVVLVARPKSATGLVMAVITVGLALAGPLLGEGVVCLVFAAPLFYLVGALLGLFMDYLRRSGSKSVNVIAVPLLVFVAIEGAAEPTSLPRGEHVSATRAVTGDIERALAAPPEFRPYESAFLKLGFPRPTAVTGSGLEPGATREITFNPRRSLGIGARPEPRSMTLRVTERGPGRVVFEVAGDSTLARWLDLREAVFTWTGGRLTVSLSYRRTFDPAWYFGPIQRYAVTQAADYLATTFAESAVAHRPAPSLRATGPAGSGAPPAGAHTSNLLTSDLLASDERASKVRASDVLASDVRASGIRGVAG